MSNKGGQPTAPTDTGHEAAGAAAAAPPSSARTILDLAPRRERRPPDSRKPPTPGRRQRVDRTLPMSEWSMDILTRRGCWQTMPPPPENTP